MPDVRRRGGLPPLPHVARRRGVILVVDQLNWEH